MLRNLPKYRGDDPYETLVNFYEDLGWDKKREIDPKKVVLSEKDNQAFMSLIMSYSQSRDKKISLGLLYMNKGPSARSDVFEGKVRLEPGWLI